MRERRERLAACERRQLGRPWLFGAAWLALAGCSEAPLAPADGGGFGDAGEPPFDAASEGDAGPRPDAGAALCPEPPACDAAGPPAGGTEDWRHPFQTGWTTAQGSARHRGRDLLLRTTDPQWAIAKFAYGGADDDLKDEDVDVWLLRDCASWELLGTATTTEEGEHATVEGIEDTGGWVFFEIPAAQRLGVGRHRIHFSVRGDRSSADQLVEVVGSAVPVVVSDIDGTLTESETAAWTEVFNGPPPAAQPTSAEALWAFARRGYRVFYLTARPHWFHAKTHEWLTLRGYPPGLVHTTLSFEGALNSAADAYKTAELAWISERAGQPPLYAIGNTDSDASAYDGASIAPSGRWLYCFDGDARGGMHFDDYADLLAVASALPAMCR